MKKLLNFTIAVVFAVSANSGFANSIFGNVMCEGDGSPLEGLTVTATQGSTVFSDDTDAAGDFGIRTGIAGVWLMSVDTPYDVTGPTTFDFASYTSLEYSVDDPACRGPICGDGNLDPGEVCDDGNNIDGDGCSAMCTIEAFCGDGILDAGEQCDDGNNINGDGCSAMCTLEVGGEGCTPGYWKQDHHFDSYPAAYPPETLFSDVFDDAFPGQTLASVTQVGGGGLNALGRHAVAALLNAASGDVSYDRTPQQVIDSFNAAFASGNYEFLKNLFETFNEQSCPLN